MFTQQNSVYENKIFVPGFRSCFCGVCRPGHLNPDCPATSGTNRHTKSEAKLQARASTHAEQSTRNTFHSKGCRADNAPADAAAAGVDVDAATAGVEVAVAVARVEVAMEGLDDPEGPEVLEAGLNF